MPENPYAPPKVPSLANEPTGSMLLWNLATVGIGAGAGSLLGILLGIFIAVVFPGYYAAVFTPNANGFQVGAGLGMVQGAFGGALVGIVLVIIHYRYRLQWTREQRLREESNTSGPQV